MRQVRASNGGTIRVSDADFEWAAGRPWHIGDRGYAKGYNAPGKSPHRMHRLIMLRMQGGTLETMGRVDHINGDKLDNRRENLRIVTQSQNAMNRHRVFGRSKYRGVARHGQMNKWMTYVNNENGRVYCGLYEDEDEAAWMRDQFAIELQGEFASLNFDYVAVASMADRQPQEAGETPGVRS